MTNEQGCYICGDPADHYNEETETNDKCPTGITRAQIDAMRAISQAREIRDRKSPEQIRLQVVKDNEDTYQQCKIYQITGTCSTASSQDGACLGLQKHCEVGEHCVLTDDNCVGRVRDYQDQLRVRGIIPVLDHPEECCVCGKGMDRIL